MTTRHNRWSPDEIDEACRLREMTPPMPYRDIAAKLGRDEKTIYMMMYHIRRATRPDLAEREAARAAQDADAKFLAALRAYARGPE